MNGKAINENLALQFRNSVPLRDSNDGQEIQPEQPHPESNEEGKQIDQATYDEFVTEVDRNSKFTYINSLDEHSDEKERTEPGEQTVNNEQHSPRGSYSFFRI